MHSWHRVAINWTNKRKKARFVVLSVPERPVDLFADKKRYKSPGSVGLRVPCDKLIEVVHKAEEAFRLNYDTFKGNSHLCQFLFTAAFRHVISHFFFAVTQNMVCILSEKLIKVYMVTRIFYSVKFNNREFDTLW